MKINKKDLIIIMLVLIIIGLCCYIFFSKNKIETDNVSLINFNISNIDEVRINFESGYVFNTKNKNIIEDILIDVDNSLKKKEYTEKVNLNKPFIEVVYDNGSIVNIIFLSDSRIIINFPLTGYYEYIMQNENYLNELITKFDK